MKPPLPFSHCTNCPLNRRNFFTRGGVAALGAVGWLSAPEWLSAASSASKSRIRIVYAVHAEKQPGPDWPNKGYDFKPFMDHINSELARRCRSFEFVSSLAAGEEEARKILETDRTGSAIDGYLVYQLNCWNRVVQTLATSGKPVLYADFQFGGSGGFLVYNATFLRQGTGNVGFVAASELQDLVAAVQCFKIVKDGGSLSDFVAATAQIRRRTTPKPHRFINKRDELKCLPVADWRRRLQESKILAVRGQDIPPSSEIMGIQIEHVTFAELNQAWQSADRDEARAVADQWVKAARKVEGVSQETLHASAAMYLAEKAVMQRHNAQGITINCLGGFYGGHIHAYPCLGFHQLNNEARVGGCECDVRSAATMLAGTILTQGRPGYISDPVIDTSRRQIIYAHCVAANKAFGPEGAANPFEILTHSEDRQGASVRSLLPIGYLTTTLQFDPGKREILLHQARTVDNDPDDRACRTKLCAEPLGDMEKLFTEWDRWGWHRVTFYGDLKEPIYALADAVGWKVTEEA